MSVKAVIFDLDGTLLDSLADLASAVNRVLAAHGLPTHSQTAYKGFVGSGALKLIEQALPVAQRTEPFIQTCLNDLLTDYSQNYLVESKLYPGIHSMLDSLRQQDLKLAVLSNKPHALTIQCANAFLTPWNFDIILGQQEGLPRKPDPTVALQIAQKLEVSPSACLFIGDSGIDMETADAAGMYPGGVLWGFRPEAELRNCGAQHLFSHPSEITELVMAL